MNTFQPSNTHPYGTVWTNAEESFGYLRISKNGSTTFSDTFNLNHTKTLSSFENVTYCTFRNPLDRFASSIFETLKRVSYLKRNISYGTDVIIEKTLFNKLFKIEFNNLLDFVKTFILLIETEGFFDAHHEPQHYFYLNPDYSLINEIAAFPLYDMKNQIYKINNKHNPKEFNYIEKNKKIQSFTVNEINSKGLGFYFNNIRNRTILDFDESELSYSLLKYLVFESCHPLVRIINYQPSKPYVGFHTKKLDLEISRIYKKLLKDKKIMNELTIFVNKNYQFDIDIYKKLNKIYKSEPISLSKLL